MSQISIMPPPPPRRPNTSRNSKQSDRTLNKRRAEETFENKSSLTLFEHSHSIYDCSISRNFEVSDEDSCHENLTVNNDIQVMTLEMLGDELQQAFRWGKLAFETPDGINSSDPLAIDAFEKCSAGLLSSALKLVSRDRFLQIMREYGYDNFIIPEVDSRPSSPSHEEEVSAARDSELTNVPHRYKSTIIDSCEKGIGRPYSSDTFLDIKQCVTDRNDLPRFEDIASLEEPKRILKEAVIFPALHPTLFQGVRQPWKGILLYGPPGTGRMKNGKTELAKAVAGECDASFLLVSPSTLLSKYVGDSERTLARIFECAKEIAPTVLFFDEIDALGMSRNADTNDQGIRRLMAELLVQFNLVKSAHRVTILAATNRIDDLDAALLRRFERRIEIGLLPDAERAKLIELKMSGTSVHSDLDFLKIARQTEGFSGADLELLCREAAMHGVRELMQNEELIRKGITTIRPVSYEDFLLALQTIFPSSKSATLSNNSEWSVENGRRQRKRSAECRSGQLTPQLCAVDFK